MIVGAHAGANVRNITEEAIRSRFSDETRSHPLAAVQAKQRQAASFDLRDLSIPAEEIRDGGPP